MNKERRDQEPMNSGNISMSSQPMADIHYFPYYSPDLQTYSNYPKMGYINNIQAINGYSNPMEFYHEEPHLNQQNKAENVTTPKNNIIPSQNSENQKAKPNITFLINTVTNLFNEGKITMKYLKEKTELKTNGINGNGLSYSECSSSPSLRPLGNYSKTNNIKVRNSYENSIGKNNIHNSIKKAGNNIGENFKCENPLCKYVFNSNKDKNKIKIKGLKTQEKKLCKKCCEAVEKGHYCYYCNAIYRDDMSDTAKWVECDFCKKWEHFECELLKGKRFSSTQELNDVNQYMCPICINEKAEQKNNDNKIQKKLINKKRKGDIFEDQKYKKNQRKDLRNLKSEKCSELLEDLQLIESFMNCK